MRGLKNLTLVWLMFAGVCLTAQSQAPPPDNGSFQVCHKDYALCTFSQCGEVQVQGGQATTMCSCNVMKDYSVGKECAGPAPLKDGKIKIMSRYHPITKYSRCTNNRQWAMCLDSPCTMADANSTQAQCQCSVVPGAQGDWLVQPRTSQCTNGLISSATVDDLDQLTDWVEKTHPELQLPNFTVVNVLPK